MRLAEYAARAVVGAVAIAPLVVAWRYVSTVMETMNLPL
jgi:hypothetical protein